MTRIIISTMLLSANRLWLLLLLAIGSQALAIEEATTTVTLSPGADARVLRAEITLPAPATGFEFEFENMHQRFDRWTPAGAGWSFDGQHVKRQDGAAFSQFELRLAPDARFYDRHYVALERVGSNGWTVFTGALRAASGKTTLRLANFPDGYLVRPGSMPQSVSSAAALDITDSDRQLFYVGPLAALAEGKVNVIAGEEIPRWLREQLSTQVGSAIAVLSSRFGATLPTAPTILVTWSAQWPHKDYKASVLDDGVIAFSLRGMNLSLQDTELADQLTNTSIHEVIHLWNGGLWKNAANVQQPWLDEGSAEYLASRLWQDSESLRAETEQRLKACMLRSDRRPLDGSQGSVRGAIPYDCGFVIQLAAEAAVLKAHQGDGFDLWRAVFRNATNHRYSPAGFLAEAERRGPGFGKVARLLLAGSEKPDISALETGLQTLGIKVHSRPADAREGDRFRTQGLMMVLSSLCIGNFGFSTQTDRLVLDTGDRCSMAINGNPEVVSVNGYSLMSDPAAAYSELRTACGNNAELVFAKPDGSRLQPVRCHVELEAVPMVFDVLALPNLPVPAASPAKMGKL